MNTRIGNICALLSVLSFACARSDGSTPWWETAPDVETTPEPGTSKGGKPAAAALTAADVERRSDVLGFALRLPETWLPQPDRNGGGNTAVFLDSVSKGGTHAYLSAQRGRKTIKKFDKYVQALEDKFLKPSYKFERADRAEIILNGRTCVRLSGSGKQAICGGKSLDIHLVYYVVDLDKSVLMLGFVGAKSDAKDLAAAARNAARSLKLFEPPYVITASGDCVFRGSGASIRPVPGWRLEIDPNSTDEDVSFTTGPTDRDKNFVAGQISVRSTKAGLAAYAARIKRLLVKEEEGAIVRAEETYDYVQKGGGPTPKIRKAHKIVWDAGNGASTVRSICTLVASGNRKIILIVHGLKKDLEAHETELMRLAESLRPARK